jgi:iron complex transport system substrate-binding protein
MSLRRALALGPAVAALLWSVGCERHDTTAKVARQSTGQSSATGLTDRVASPSVADAERDTACSRLLSAAPNVTEICCALGLRDCLVGRTRYCTYPPSIEQVPSIGALNDLNPEALLAIKSDLILISGSSRAIADRLVALGLKYESVPDDSLTDLYTAIERIGALTGRAQTAALLTEGIRADLAAVAARFAGRPQARVLIVTAPLADPPTRVDAAGPGSFYGDLLELAGDTNAADPSGRAFAPLGLEFVLRADPDVIIELAPDAAVRPAGDADALGVWAKVGPLHAAARGRVHVLIGPQYFLLGPRIAQTFEALCAAIAESAHE